MNSRERFDLTVNHKQPDRLVVDMGATAVTGIHVLAVENLRKFYGLANRPVRVIEPFQMLGEVDQELLDIIGIDVVGAWGKNNMFGVYNHAPYKEMITNWGQKVLVPEGELLRPDPNCLTPRARALFDVLFPDPPAAGADAVGQGHP